MITDISPSAHEMIAGKDTFLPANSGYRPMRGQAYIQVTQPLSTSGLVVLPGNPREDKSHRGKVLALGDPARVTDYPDSPEVPWGIQVGDEVEFVLAVWLDRMRMLEMLGVEGHVAVVAQVEILGVWE